MKSNYPAVCLALAALCGVPLSAQTPVDDVRQAEAAFAATMVSRDLGKFSESVSAEAIFFTGGKVLHGKREVLTAWKGFFEAQEAPFAWKPEIVEVLESGRLALSSGPVYDQKGVLIARFNSIWRLEGDGKWRVIFDKGEKVCH